MPAGLTSLSQSLTQIQAKGAALQTGTSAWSLHFMLEEAEPEGVHIFVEMRN